MTGLKKQDERIFPPDYASGEHDPFNLSWNQIFITTTPHKHAGSLVQDYSRGKYKGQGEDKTLIFFLF